jgi:hypothetical protein
MTSVQRYRVTSSDESGNPYLTTFYQGATADPTAVADAIQAFFDAVKNYQSSGWTWVLESNYSVLQVEDGSLLSEAEVGVSVGGGGTDTSALLPRQVQGLVQWRTISIISRRLVRGKTFIPGLTQSASDHGSPASGFVLAMTTAGSAYLAAAPSPLVYSRPILHGPKAREGLVSDITSATAWDTFANLRSRRT